MTAEMDDLMHDLYVLDELIAETDPATVEWADLMDERRILQHELEGDPK